LQGTEIGALRRNNMVFSDTTNRTGIVQLLEDATHSQSDVANSSAYSLHRKVRDINQAYAHFTRIAFSRWKGFDISNSVKLPIIYFSIQNGVTNYAPTYDGETVPNKILNLFQVRMKDKNGDFQLLTRIDRSDFDVSQFDGQSGSPTHYEVIGSTIIPYPTPDYDSIEGIELNASRAPSYFTVSDTTREPGIPDDFQDYIWIRPAYLYSLINLPSLATGYRDEMLRLQREIELYYTDISNQVQDVITSQPIEFI